MLSFLIPPLIFKLTCKYYTKETYLKNILIIPQYLFYLLLPDLWPDDEDLETLLDEELLPAETELPDLEPEEDLAKVLADLEAP
jgi:hypothetical protein